MAEEEAGLHIMFTGRRVADVGKRVGFTHNVNGEESSRWREEKAERVPI